MRPRNPRLSFKEGTQAREQRDAIAAELKGVSSVKEPFAVATATVKKQYRKRRNKRRRTIRGIKKGLVRRHALYPKRSQAAKEAMKEVRSERKVTRLSW